MYAKNLSEKIEDKLLATHVSKNSDFEAACQSGDGTKIMSIIETEMQKQNLFTKGAKKLQADVLRMLRGQAKVSPFVGQQVLMFIWNSRLAGIGYAAVN